MAFASLSENSPGTALFERPGGSGEKGLRQEEPGVGSHRWQVGRTPGGQKIDRADAQGAEEALELILHDFRERAHDQETGGCCGRPGGQPGHQAGEAGVFSLGKGRFDAVAGVIQDPHLGRVGA